MRRRRKPPRQDTATKLAPGLGMVISGRIVAGVPRSGDQVIRENPANRGTETSAEVLVGPPWRMESNAGQQQWWTRLTLTLDGGPMGHSAR